MSRLTELLTKATPGPWIYYDNGFDAGIAQDGNYIIFGGEPSEGWIPFDADAALTITLRNNADKFQALWDAAALVKDTYPGRTVAMERLIPVVEALRDLMGDSE